MDREKMVVVKPDINNLQNLSVESLINYIRFYAFHDVSDSDKKQLFMEMMDVRARDPDVFPGIKAALESDDFDKLKDIIYSNENKVKSTMSESIVSRSEKRMAIILDGYFSESNTVQARDLLTYLIFYPNPSDESLKAFVKRYVSSDPHIQKLLLPNNSGHFCTI